MSLIRSTLFQSGILHVRHARCRPTSVERRELEYPSADLLVLPVSGVFARHDGPRHRVIANSNHALFFRNGEPYRLSFPGCIGDDCLTLEFPPAELQRALSETTAADRLDSPGIAAHMLLPPAAILRRSLLWRQLTGGAADPLYVEETAMLLLKAALSAASAASRVGGRAPRHATASRRLRQVEAVKEAVSARPHETWTLQALARLAGASPYHLARIFSDEVGAPIHRYLMRARLAKALEVLLDTQVELSALALDCGFSSHSHFSASFRALFGVAPAELRRGAASRKILELRKIVTA